MKSLQFYKQRQWIFHLEPELIRNDNGSSCKRLFIAIIPRKSEKANLGWWQQKEKKQQEQVEKQKWNISHFHLALCIR